MSAVIVMISMALIVPYNFKVLAICTIIYFVYSIVSLDILNITSLTNYIFTFIASIVILVWFIVCGMHNNDAE